MAKYKSLLALIANVLVNVSFVNRHLSSIFGYIQLVYNTEISKVIIELLRREYWNAITQSLLTRRPYGLGWQTWGSYPLKMRARVDSTGYQNIPH